ncbi:uncharacterized protein LOC105008929 [Esox lucius]|uniref:uncharacterized protein LOC105008929 n=1 Tax=Esox lucius TaxID=8010 RepID=UPI0014774A29|nr:uncharacterized protein LOC105008929 [Esox lucius]XP_019911769.2 uncharacterized protein LOC105008929 [Esox lucius]XP_019911770.2 uncharacterized protein LOC105008929 [Esox lucius]XP_019911779.2 uncharacterized protein LOC105008929 [Esox lucius]
MLKETSPDMAEGTGAGDGVIKATIIGAQDLKITQNLSSINAVSPGVDQFQRPTGNLSGKEAKSVFVKTPQGNPFPEVVNLVKEELCDISIGSIFTSDTVSMFCKDQTTQTITHAMKTFQVHAPLNQEVLASKDDSSGPSIAIHSRPSSPATTNNCSSTPVLHPCHIQTQPIIVTDKCQALNDQSAQSEHQHLWQWRSSLALKTSGSYFKYLDCKRIGLSFNVGSEEKQKLNLELLTNGVMFEVYDFAKEMNKCHQQVVFDILDYNFELNLQHEQQHAFTGHTMSIRLIEMIRQSMSVQEKTDLLAEVFELPEVTLNADEISRPTLGLVGECADIAMRVEDCPLVLSPSFDNESVKAGQENGPVNTCIMDKPDLDPSLQCAMISQKKEVTLCDDRTTHSLVINHSPLGSTMNKVSNDYYTCCKKIDIDFNLKSKSRTKKKLSLDLLSKDVMIEVDNFATKVCGSYKEIVCDVLQHNFELDLQSGKTQLSLNIMSDLMKIILEHKQISSSQESLEFSKKVFLEFPKKTDVSISQEMLDLYPRCKAIGVDLDMNRQSKAKQKIDLVLLTDGVMYEVHKFARTHLSEEIYACSLCDILEYNFNMNLQSLNSLCFTTSIGKKIRNIFKNQYICKRRQEANVQLAVASMQQHNLSQVAATVVEQDSEKSHVDICRKMIHKILKTGDLQQLPIFSKVAEYFAPENKLKQILAKYKSDILPYIVEEYSNFSYSDKQMMSLVNELFCGLHLIDCLAHQAKTTLLIWERIILGNAPSTGKTELKAETVRLVNTVNVAIRELKLPQFSPSSGNRFDSLFNDGAVTYSIHDDVLEFSKKWRTGKNVLAEFTADLQVPLFKAGCRALGLISKLVIDPLWRALSWEGNVLEMEIRYQTLIAKLKKWQDNGRDIVEGTAQLFDDIKVTKDLVLDRLTMCTDTDFFELTVQIVELLSASFLKVCCKALSGNQGLASEVVKNVCFKKDLFVLKHLQKVKSNAISIALEATGMFKRNRTLEWLLSFDKQKKMCLLKELQQAVKQHGVLAGQRKTNRTALAKSIERKLEIDRNLRKPQTLAKRTLNTKYTSLAQQRNTKTQKKAKMKPKAKEIQHQLSPRPSLRKAHAENHKTTKSVTRKRTNQEQGDRDDKDVERERHLCNESDGKTKSKALSEETTKTLSQYSKDHNMPGHSTPLMTWQQTLDEPESEAVLAKSMEMKPGKLRKPEALTLKTTDLSCALQRNMKTPEKAKMKPEMKEILPPQSLSLRIVKNSHSEKHEPKILENQKRTFKEQDGITSFAKKGLQDDGVEMEPDSVGKTKKANPNALSDLTSETLYIPTVDKQQTLDEPDNYRVLAKQLEIKPDVNRNLRKRQSLNKFTLQTKYNSLPPQRNKKTLGKAKIKPNAKGIQTQYSFRQSSKIAYSEQHKPTTSVSQKRTLGKFKSKTLFSKNKLKDDGMVLVMEKYLCNELKRYRGLWKKVKDVDRMLTSLGKEERYSAVICQLLFHRHVLGAKNDQGLLNTSVAGRALNLHDLVRNLKKIISRTF